MKSSRMTKAGRPPGSRSRRGRWTSRVEVLKNQCKDRRCTHVAQARLPVAASLPGGRPRGSPESRTLNGPARAWGGAPCPAGDPPQARPRKGPAEVPARLPGPPRRGLPLSRCPGASPACQWAATARAAAAHWQGLSLPVARAGRCHCQWHVITASSVPFRVSLFKAPGLICLLSPQRPESDHAQALNGYRRVRFIMRSFRQSGGFEIAPEIMPALHVLRIAAECGTCLTCFALRSSSPHEAWGEQQKH